MTFLQGQMDEGWELRKSGRTGPRTFTFQISKVKQKLNSNLKLQFHSFITNTVQTYGSIQYVFNKPGGNV